MLYIRHKIKSLCNFSASRTFRGGSIRLSCCLYKLVSRTFLPTISVSTLAYDGKLWKKENSIEHFLNTRRAQNKILISHLTLFIRRPCKLPHLFKEQLRYRRYISCLVARNRLFHLATLSTSIK